MTKLFRITYHNPPLREFFTVDIQGYDETQAIINFMKHFPKNSFYSCIEL